MDYTNWEPRMPNSDLCVAVSSETGQWRTTSCTRYKSYICKLAKGRQNLIHLSVQMTSSFKCIHSHFSVVTLTETPPSVGKLFDQRYVSVLNFCDRNMNATLFLVLTAKVITESSQGSPGVTVAVILFVIAAVGLGGFLFFRKKIHMPVLGESNFDNKLYFNNPLRGNVDTNRLVANIEQNEHA